MALLLKRQKQKVGGEGEGGDGKGRAGWIPYSVAATNSKLGYYLKDFSRHISVGLFPVKEQDRRPTTNHLID